MKQDRRIFISSTSSDLGSYRDVVCDELLHKDDVRPVQQRHFSPSYQTLKSKLGAKIESCDAVICLIGTAYGEEPKNRPGSEARRSYTQMEFDLARDLGKPIYLFIADEEKCEFDSAFNEDQEKKELQQLHRLSVQNDDVGYDYFTTHEDLRKLIARIDFDELPVPKRSFPWWILCLGLVVIGLCAAFWMKWTTTDPSPKPGPIPTTAAIPIPEAIPTPAAVPTPTPVARPVQGGQDLSAPANPKPSLVEEKKGEPKSSPLNPLTLEMKDSYQEGEYQEIGVIVHQDGYLYVATCEANGNSYLLYPNFHWPKNGENKVNAGQKLNLPNDLPPDSEGKVMRYPMFFPESVPDNLTKETIFAFISPFPIELPEAEVDADFGPAFRKLGILQDREGFRTRGARPELRFKEATISLHGLQIITKEYTIQK